MKLLNFQFAHFKSIQDVFMKNIGDLNILVGPNNAGKSNILDAIEFFFKGWTADINGDIEYLDVVWPEILREDAIKCTAEVEVSTAFLKEGTDERVHRLLKRTGSSKACIITIKLEITPDSRKWTTTDVIFNDIALVRESNILSDESDATLQILARLTQLFWNRFRRLDIVGSKATMSRRSTIGSREVIIRETTIDEINQWINSTSSAGRQRFSRFKYIFRLLSV